MTRARTYLWRGEELLEEGEFTISSADRGLLYGDGIFETMRSYAGRVHLLSRHLERMREGCTHLEIPMPADVALRDAIDSVIARIGIPDGAIRLTITRGPGDGIEPPLNPTPTILVTWRPLLHPGIQTEAEDLVILTPRRMLPELGFAMKTTSYLTSTVCRLELRRRGAHEGILLTPNGLVAEGSFSNIFAVRSGVLHTPSIDTGLLPGITRGRVIELATAADLTVSESDLTPRQIATADECFYTNSGRELVPVGRLEGETIGNGTRGPITDQLQQAYNSEAPLD